MRNTVCVEWWHCVWLLWLRLVWCWIWLGCIWYWRVLIISQIWELIWCKSSEPLMRKSVLENLLAFPPRTAQRASHPSFFRVILVFSSHPSYPTCKVWITSQESRASSDFSKVAGLPLSCHWHFSGSELQVKRRVGLRHLVTNSWRIVDATHLPVTHKF